MSLYLALDVGGTHLRAALYPEDGLEPIQHKRINTQGEDTPLERLFCLVEKILPPREKVSAIGVAAAGPLNTHTGVILKAVNIPGWKELPLRDELQNRFQVPVKIGNDANLAALGESKFGSGRGHHHILYLTISTGIGGGVIIDDRLLNGAWGLAGELGHITVMPGGPLCSCGQSGHLEAVASGTAIARYVNEQITSGVPSSLTGTQPLTAKEVAQAARAGDRLSKEAFERAGKFIGRTVADFLHIFNPTVVIFGGGVSKSGSLLLNPINQTMRTSILIPQYLDNLVVTTASLGDEAGLLGALALARQTT
ncbi:MAG: ROK family protein [Chloroflexota bacterium]